MNGILESPSLVRTDENRQPLVQAQGVRKSFGQIQVLKGIDLQVDPGQVMCLLGPSGSGKSTFLRCINHLERIDGGRINFDGELIGYAQRNGKLHEMKPHEVARQRRGIGMVFQRFNLFPHLTALENIIAAPIGIRKVPKGQAIAQAHELLDPELVGDVLDVMQKLAASGMTMIVVTHEIGFARNVADEVVFMDGGVVVESGAPAEVLGNPGHERTRAFLENVI